MIVLPVRNVHEALPEAIRLLGQWGQPRDTRNGKALVAPEPVTTRYAFPRERVLFWPERDANPFFHFYESLWMLGGRNDVKSLTRFVGRMAQFSDDGKTFHGAYGYRWRGGCAPPLDQLNKIVEQLRKYPEDRRAVLQMWQHTTDLGRDGKDVPCNLVAHFQVNAAGMLDMTVFNRSNDIIWGCYGANAVHFSYLQEYVAARLGRNVGTYWQVSDNWHAYVDVFEPLRPLADKVHQLHRVVQWENPYDNVQPYDLFMVNAERWEQELATFLDVGAKAMGYQEPFFRRVALPMVLAHDAHKQHDYELALVRAGGIGATDWRRAVIEWLQRRRQKHDARTEAD